MNWVDLFTDNNVRYVTAGPNTSKGWASVACPFCGANDPSQHMGVNLGGTHWACWRDATHKGSTPERLIRALLGVSQARARALVQAYSRSDPDSLNAPVPTTAAPEAEIVKWPFEFVPIERGKLTHRFWSYVQERGFAPDLAIERYQLKACLTGRWKGRLIIPVLGNNDELLGWQGRALAVSSKAPRYLTSSSSVKKTLFNLNHLQGGETLFLCEGPFDAMKVDFYGYKHGVNATCGFGVNLTPEQIQLLSSLRQHYRRVVLLFDNDDAAVTSSFGLADWLPGIEFGSLPSGVKDPGGLSATQVMEVIDV